MAASSLLVWMLFSRRAEMRTPNPSLGARHWKVFLTLLRLRESAVVTFFLPFVDVAPHVMIVMFPWYFFRWKDFLIAFALSQAFENCSRRHHVLIWTEHTNIFLCTGCPSPIRVDANGSCPMEHLRQLSPDSLEPKLLNNGVCLITLASRQRRSHMQHYSTLYPILKFTLGWPFSSMPGDSVSYSLFWHWKSRRACAKSSTFNSNSTTINPT